MAVIAILTRLYNALWNIERNLVQWAARGCPEVPYNLCSTHYNVRMRNAHTTVSLSLS
jgi:hypothetical protein